MNKNAERAAKLIDKMARAVDPEGQLDMSLVAWNSGATYNDGGCWYSTVWRLPGGDLRRATISTDYRPDDIHVEGVKARNFSHTVYDPS